MRDLFDQSTPAPLRHEGVAGVDFPLSPLRHSGAGGDPGKTGAHSGSRHRTGTSGRGLQPRQRRVNETDKLQAEMAGLVRALDEWGSRSRELDRISDGYRSHFDAAHSACVDVVRDIGHPPYTNPEHSDRFQAAYRSRFVAGCAWEPHRKAARDAARYLKEVKKRMAEIKEELADV